MTEIKLTQDVNSSNNSYENPLGFKLESIKYVGSAVDPSNLNWFHPKTVQYERKESALGTRRWREISIFTTTHIIPPARTNSPSHTGTLTLFFLFLTHTMCLVALAKI